MTSDDDRVAYLAGDGPSELDDTEREHLDALKELLSEAAVWELPADRLEDAVVAAITDEVAAASPLRSVPGGAAPAGRSRWRRPLPVVGAVAAAAAILVVAVVIGSGSGGPSASLAAALDPTDLVPDAHGEAAFTRTDSGWRIELDASGLPRRDGGRFYQAWLEGADGVLVSVGTFNEGADVVLWAGVPPTDYPTLTITEEAADGNPASSGRDVLVGPITAR